MSTLFVTCSRSGCSSKDSFVNARFNWYFDSEKGRWFCPTHCDSPTKPLSVASLNCTACQEYIDKVRGSIAEIKRTAEDLAQRLEKLEDTLREPVNG